MTLTPEQRAGLNPRSCGTGSETYSALNHAVLHSLNPRSCGTGSQTEQWWFEKLNDGSQSA